MRCGCPATAFINFRGSSDLKMLEWHSIETALKATFPVFTKVIGLSDQII